MTKKDYIAIANLLADIGKKEIADETFFYLTERLADHFKIDNPNFDYERFMDAIYKDI
jgi:hypothetical protein